MFKPVCLAGQELADAEQDFRGAEKIEQYRLSAKALYIPAGLRWSYLPLTEISAAEAAHRVISAGKCVGVQEKRPRLDLETSAGPMQLNLEKARSMERMLELLRR